MKLERYADCPYVDKCNEIPTECEKCTQRKAMQYQLQESGLPKNRWRPDDLYPDNCDLEIFKDLAYIKKEIVDMVRKTNDIIYLCCPSNPNIASSWAVKMLLRYLDKTEFIAWRGTKPTGKYINLPQFFRDSKDFDDKKNLNYEGYSLVVVDGITEEVLASMTNYDKVSMGILIGQRYNSCTIFAGSVLPEYLSKQFSVKLGYSFVMRGKYI